MNPKVGEHKGLSVLRFESAPLFRQWLEENQEQTETIWLQFAKKGTGVETVSYIEARDIALCFGWIDSLINKYDETFYLVKFSPRRKKSVWSKVNQKVVEQLIADGLMTPRGLREIEEAKADGRWERAYSGKIPPARSAGSTTRKPL